MSENPLVASDLLLGDHMTRYGHHFENITTARSSQKNHLQLLTWFSRSGSSLMTIDLMSDDHIRCHFLVGKFEKLKLTFSQLENSKYIYHL